MIDFNKFTKQFLPFTSYLFSFVLLMLTFFGYGILGPSIISLIELIIITILVNMLFRFGRRLANVVKFFLLLFFNIQISVLLFSGTYTTLIMVTNLASIEALSGNAGLYITSTILVLFFSAIPTKEFKFNKLHSFFLFTFVILIEFILLSITQISFSPSYSIVGLTKELYNQYQTQKRIENMPNYTSEFYHEEIDDAIKAPETLGENPNIVLIFTEGLSQNIIDDRRNIMPNLASFQSQSIDFENYFNHTFATYRGIQGQLYSGYQFKNEEKNTLTSVQEILNENGYITTFINSEPKNSTFTKYLDDFEFDSLITSTELDGPAETVTDKDLYQQLFSEMENLSSTGEPFFIATYTFGTHISLDSPNEMYQDGDNALLNRFYNLDAQFGIFFEKFKESQLSKNTIIIFTSDHANFVDNDFRESFPNYKRNHGMVDEIPLYIYFSGVQPLEIDVNGRNSLGLAPTILDLVDISDSNYFLGNSLFNVNMNIFDTTFVSETTRLSTNSVTDGAHILPFNYSESPEFETLLEQYYAAKNQKPETP